jgi:hypothetical protein
VIVYAVIDLRSSPDHPLGDAIETFIRRGGRLVDALVDTLSHGSPSVGTAASVHR